MNSTPQFTFPVFNYDDSPAIPCLTVPTLPPATKTKYEVSAVVEENLNDITTHFVVKKFSKMLVVCSPSLLVLRLLQACGIHRILCSRQGCPKIDISGLSVAIIEGEGRHRDESLERLGYTIGLRLVGDNPIARLMALLVDRTYRSNVPSESRSRLNHFARDGWLNFGDSVHLSTEEDSEVNQLHTQYDAEGANAPSQAEWDRNSSVILQRDECLPCTIRRAVAITGSKSHNVYIVCR